MAAALDDEFRLRARSFERASSWARDPNVLAHAEYVCGRPNISRIVDLGGGTGALSAHLADIFGISDVLVVDSSKDMLSLVPKQFATRKEDVSGFVENYRDAGHTLWLARQVLHYLDRPEDFLCLLRRRCAESSCVYVGQFAALSPKEGAHLFQLMKAQGTNRKCMPSMHELLGWFEAAGFSREVASIQCWNEGLESWLGKSLQLKAAASQLQEAGALACEPWQQTFYFDGDQVRFRSLLIHALYT